MNRGRIFTSALALAAGTALWTVPAAAKMQAKVETTARLAYDTNPFLSTGDDLATGSAIVEVDPSLSWVTEKGQVVLGAHYDHTEYFKNYGSADGYGLYLNGKQKLSPTLDVNGGLSYDSRIIGQRDDTIFVSPGVPIVDDTDVNFIGTRQRSEIYQATGGFDWKVGPRDTIKGNAFGTAVRYKDRPLGSDSNSYGGTLGYQRAVSAHTRVGVSGTVYRIDYDRPGLSTLVMQPSVTFSTDLSATWTADASLGITFSQLTLPGPGNDLDDTGWAGSLNLCHRGRLNDFCVSASRSVSASGLGGTATRDAVAFNFRQRLSERLSATAGGSYVRSDSQIPLFNGFFGTRDYISLQGGLSYRVTPALSIGADARYRDVFGAGVPIKSDIGGDISATLVLPGTP